MAKIRFCYLPEFVAKMETLLHPVLKEFIIQSLMALLDLVGEDRLLCPVRTLRYYLHAVYSGWQGILSPVIYLCHLRTNTLHVQSRHFILYYVR